MKKIRRPLLFAIFIMCIVGYASSFAASRISSVELIQNRCLAMQEFLDRLGTEFVNADRKIDLLPQSLLIQLSSNDIASVEALFRCFRFQEARPSLEELRSGIIRKIITEIDIAKLRVTSDATPSLLEIIARVTLIVRQKQDGTLISWGEYRVG